MNIQNLIFIIIFQASVQCTFKYMPIGVKKRFSFREQEREVGWTDIYSLIENKVNIPIYKMGSFFLLIKYFNRSQTIHVI